MNAANYIDLEKKNYKDGFVDFLRGLDGAYAEKSDLHGPQLASLVPKESFPDESYWKPMIELIEKTIEKGEIESIRTKSILDLKQKSELDCDQILGKFILHTSDLFTENLYKEFIILISMFRKALSEKGKLYRLKDPNQTEIEGEFCKTNFIEVAPEVANLFIAEIYPTYFAQMKNK